MRLNRFMDKLIRDKIASRKLRLILSLEISFLCRLHLIHFLYVTSYI